MANSIIFVLWTNVHIIDNDNWCYVTFLKFCLLFLILIYIPSINGTVKTTCHQKTFFTVIFYIFNPIRVPSQCSDLYQAVLIKAHFHRKSTLFLRFLASHNATVVSSEQVANVLLSKNLMQLTQSLCAFSIVLAIFRVRGSNIRMLFLSQAAANIFPSELNSMLKIPPGLETRIM